MRIAIVSPGKFSVPPVTGTSVEYVINQLATRLKEKHTVTVYTRKCKEYPQSTKEGTLLYKRFSYSNSVNYLKKVIRHLKKSKPDLLVVENRPSYLLEIKQAHPTIPILLNMHSEVFSSERYINHRNMMEVSKLADGLITNSHALASTFTEKYPLFIGKTFPIHLGIDMAPFELAQNNHKLIREWRTKLGIENDAPVLLFAGRIIKRKGVHLLLDVLPKLIEKNPKLTLIITGSTKYGSNKQTKYRKRVLLLTEKVKNHVVFTDFIQPIQMPIIYQLADIVITPSIWNEPFLLVNLEAMASQKAVISTSNGGISEVVLHGETGYVFSSDQYKLELPLYIQYLLDSKETREKLALNGKNRAKMFSWEKAANRYLSVFHKIAYLEKKSSHIQ